MAKRSKKLKLKSWVIEFIIFVLVVLLLSRNINKVLNIFQSPATKKIDKTEEFYTVEGFDTVLPEEENLSKELETE